MKKAFLLFWILCCAAMAVQAQVTIAVGTPVVGYYTVAGLPAAGVLGRVAVVTDASVAGSCTVGGGSALTLCRDSGAAWIPLGDGDSVVAIGAAVTGGTACSVLFVGTGPVLAQDNANFCFDDTNNTLAVGPRTGFLAPFDAATGVVFGLSLNSTTHFGSLYGIAQSNVTSIGSTAVYGSTGTNNDMGTKPSASGMYGEAIHVGNGTLTAQYGGSFYAQVNAGTVTVSTGLDASAYIMGGTVTTARGLSLAVTNDGGTVTDMATVYVAPATTSSGTTSGSGISVLIDDSSACGAATACHNVYSLGTTATNVFEGLVTSRRFQTTTNCADSAGAAACGAASAGAFVVDAGGTSTVVSTTAITANSQVFVFFDSGLGTRLGVTCNTTVPALYGVSARTAGTSFTLTATAPVTNPACFNYFITN